MLLIASIDPSLTGTAVCILDANTNNIIDLITFKVPKGLDGKGLDGIARINWLVKKLNAFLKKHDPYEIFIEGYSYNSRGRSVISLGELGGVYRLMLARKWGSYYEIPPNSLKKFITNKGNAPKQIMLEQTFRKYGLGSETLTNDNEVDAYGLARFGSAFLTWKLGNTKFAKYEIEALKGLKTKCTL